MPGVRFVIDSTADLPMAWRREHEVITVPLLVIFGDEQLRDGIDIEPREFYARMRSSAHHPRTSQPTPDDFATAFREAAKDGASVVCTTISSKMSGTHGSALAARERLPELDIRVVDTRTAGLGHNAIARAVVAAAAAGADAGEVVALAERIRGAQSTVFTVSSLESLRRGGRIGGASALLGSVLSIKPVLQIKDGGVEALDRVRTFQRALDRIVADVLGEARTPGSLSITIAHADNPAAAAALLPRLAPCADGPIAEIEVGPVVGCHGGPGAVGVTWYPAGIGQAP